MLQASLRLLLTLGDLVEEANYLESGINTAGIYRPQVCLIVLNIISCIRTKPRTTALKQFGDGGASITGLLEEILMA